MAKKVKKIIWTVDAFSENNQLQLKLADQLKEWAKDPQVEILPVTILSPDQLNLPSLFFSQNLKDVQTVAAEKIGKLAKKSKLSNLGAPVVLISNNVSLRSAVGTLLSYAKDEDVDLIAVSTQSKKGVSHFLFGSFAEGLILQSEIPTFIISPKTRTTKKMSSLFFSTDFSEASKDVFENVLLLAKEKGLAVTIFNKVDYLSDYTLPAFSGPIYAKFLQEDIKKRKQDLDALVEKARNFGVKSKGILDKSSSLSISDAVISAANKSKAGMIAMASQTGPVVSALLGSATRQVIRLASCPIWVIHPHHTKPTSQFEKTPSKSTRSVIL